MKHNFDTYKHIYVILHIFAHANTSMCLYNIQFGDQIPALDFHQHSAWVMDSFLSEKSVSLTKRRVYINIVNSMFFHNTDTIAERRALREHVYPKLREFCRENYGLEFQVGFVVLILYYFILKLTLFRTDNIFKISLLKQKITKTLFHRITHKMVEAGRDH